MTVAQQGLRQALARGASGNVLAIAEMDPDDLLAGLNDDQKAALAAKLAPAASASADAGAAPAGSASEDNDTDDMGGDTDKCSKCGDPMKDSKCKKCSTDASAEAAAEDPVAAARAEERKRYTSVMSSEHYKGRESLAATLLGNDKLSADEIITALASASASVSDGAADAEAGATLLNAMKAFGNPDTADAKTGNQQQANHGWSDIHAEVRERRAR